MSNAPTDASQPDAGRKTIKLTIPGHEPFYVLPSWTGSVAARCRRELGITPVEMITMLSTDPTKVDMDVIAGLMALARWQAGEPATAAQFLALSSDAIDGLEVSIEDEADSPQA